MLQQIYLETAKKRSLASGNAVFQKAIFKTYSLRMRVKEDHYSDESKLKHIVHRVVNT